MPGNDVGDRVHNFFAQDSLSQGQHNSPVVDGNWPADNNLWVGSQRQIGALTLNTKNYNLQNSVADSGKGLSGYPFTSQHGLDYMQSTPKREFGKGQSKNQQINLNGYMHGNQFYQTRQDESKFLAIDTGYDQRSLASRGLSLYASHQGVGPEQQTRVLVRSEPSENPASFDLFGGQQMNHQQSNMLQSLQRQQSGHSDMQQVQLMLKMQELQRQHQLQQLDTRQQDTLNQVSTLSKVASGSHPPALVHDYTNSGALSYPWSSDLGNTNWLQRGSPIIQGCSNGLNPTNIGQAQDLIPLSADQCLKGVPASGSRGSVSPFSQGIADKPTAQPMLTFDSSFPVNQYTGLQDQATGQDGTSIPRQRSPGDNLFGHAPSQSLTNALNMKNPQQANIMQRNSAFQDFYDRQGLAVPLENSQEKAGEHASASQKEVGLDPAEEKILFGSEDNMWSSFGKSPNMNGESGNPFDGERLMNGLSSLQSGTWSALMHSAVAETSSSDPGVQEDWSGLNFHSTEILTQNLMYNSGRHKTSSAEDNLPPNSSLTSVSVQPSGGTTMNSNYSNVQGHRLPYEPGQSLHAKSSQRIVQSSEEGNKWSNSGQRQKSAAEVSQIMFGSSSHPINREINMKKISGPLTSELGGARQLWDKTAGWGDVGSAVPSGDAALRVSSENSSNFSQDDKRKKFIQAEVVQQGVMWNSDSGNNSAVNMEHVGSSIANHQVNSEVFNLQNSASVPNSSTIRGEETSQLQNNYHSDYWKNTNPFVKSMVSEGLGVLQHHVTKDNQVLPRGISDVEAKMHEMQNSDNKNSNDSYRSNFIPHSPAANMRENILSDASDSRSIPTGKQNSSHQAGQKNSWPRKFQYHPIGSMDEGLDRHYRKEPSHSLSMLLQNANHVQSEVFGVAKSREELEEGQPYDVKRDGKDFTEVHSQSSFHSGGSSISCPFNKSDLHSPNKASQTSPNMLQLLQKVDQSSVHGSMTQLSNSEQKVSSEMPEAENSDGSVGHFQQSQFSVSQGFGLQLGPPSQLVSIPNHSLSSQLTQAVRSLHSHAAEEIRGKSQGQMRPPHQGQSLTPAEHSLEELKNDRSWVPGSTCNEASLYTMPGKFSSSFDSSSGFPYLRSPLQDPPVVRGTGQLSTNRSITVSFDKHGPSSAEKGDSRRGPGSGQSVQASIPEGAGDDKLDNPSISAGKPQLSNANGPHEWLSANQVSSKEPGSVSQPISMSGIGQQGASSKMFANMWTNFPPQQPLFVAQSTKDSSHIHQSHQLNNMESSLSAAERQGDQDANKGWKFASELGTSTVNILSSVEGEEGMEDDSRQPPFQNIEPVQMNDSQEREPVANLSEGSPTNSTSMQRDIEAFGRSLKPNNFTHPNYSLLYQMQAMKDVEADPSEKPLKRMRVSDRNMGVQQILSAGSRIVSFSGRENLQRSVPLEQGGNVTPQDVLASHHNDAQSSSQNNSTYSFKPEHTQISPPMAPSWFNQYGTFKNALMLQTYEANRASSMKTTGQRFTLGKSSNVLQAFDSMQRVIPANADRSNLGQSSFASSAAIEDFSSPQTLPLNAGQHHQLLKPKKRRRVTSELTPWCKEVSLDSRGKETISLAETEWAKSTHRLVEEVEEDIDLIEHGPLRLKVKRRLILTTQLMQQLFRPPSAILFSDANSEYENVAYSTSRLVLGDACSIVSCSNGDSSAPHTSKEPFHDKHNRSERYDNHMFAKAVEELTVRARRLENDFSRLDKRASILDVIVEGQDIEKFSVIYRFAKFHGRVQSDGGDTSSSSDARSHKPLAQRYVAALPMPKNLPSMIQCLSL